MRFISEAPSARLGARCEPRNTARSRTRYTINRTVQRITACALADQQNGVPGAHSRTRRRCGPLVI